MNCRLYSFHVGKWLVQLTVLVIGIHCFSVAAHATQANLNLDRPPNVILVLADDLGYETLSVNGSVSYTTPNLDRLAQQGVRFTNCFVQPLCTPTRVQLMTGRYNVRNYTRFGHIDPELTVFSQLFQRAGYATCIVGKWQLGQAVDLPKRLGFDEYYLWQHTRRPPRYANPGLEVMGVEKDFTNGEYGPDLLNEYAKDFISRHRHRPFLLYYCLTLTHSPFQPTPDSSDWDPRAVGERVNNHRRFFPDNVAYMDKLIGQLVEHLEKLGLKENTLLLFMGDNGTAATIRSQTVQGEIVGGKGKTISAGMHVPLIVHWPAAHAAGTVCHDLVDSTDLFPTICEAAGVPVPPELQLDGRSFLPQVRGERGTPRQWVYCWFSRDGVEADAVECVFDHQFKLYRDGRFYAYRSDPEERNPLTVDSLSDEAVAARERLARVLDTFKEARPQHLRLLGKLDSNR